jgi:hypothetical protein
MKQNEIAMQLTPLAARADIPDDAKAVLNSTIKTLGSPLGSDVWIYRAVVVVLGICVISTVLGGIFLVVYGKGEVKMALPDGIVAIGSAAVGALAGLLAPSRNRLPRSRRLSGKRLLRRRSGLTPPPHSPRASFFRHPPSPAPAPETSPYSCAAP